jgi:hypothetical protein
MTPSEKFQNGVVGRLRAQRYPVEALAPKELQLLRGGAVGIGLKLGVPPPK